MKNEYNALMTNITRILVPLYPIVNEVNCIWLLKKKHNMDGLLARYKDGLVEKVEANTLH